MAPKPNPETPTAPITSWRKLAESSEDVQKFNAFKVKLDLIYIEEGFNVRDMHKPSTLAKVEGLKRAYLTDPEKVPPLMCQLMDDGRVQVVDGQCRLTAARQARDDQRSRGVPKLEYLVVIPFRGNDADRLAATYKANQGERLTPLEAGEMCKRYLAMGWGKHQIATEFDFTTSWLDRLLFLANMPERIKVLVNHDKVAPDVALKVVKNYGERAAESVLLAMIEDAKKEAPADKEVKVTKKHLKTKEPVPTVATPREEPTSGPVEVTSDPEPEQTLVEKWDATFNKPPAAITEQIDKLNEEASAAPAPAKPAKKASKLDPMEVAIRLAQHLPPLELAEDNVMGNWEYDLKVNGHVYRALLQLQALLKDKKGEE